MAIVLDSNSPYYEDFTKEASKNAVYLTGFDPLFGDILSVIYQSSNSPAQKLSSLLISSHGTSGFVDMTLTNHSRYFSAVNNLPEIHKNSLVRNALAVSTLRAYATMDPTTKDVLAKEAHPLIYNWDESLAGLTASKMKLVTGKFPDEMGGKIRQLGLIEPKHINTALLDVVYVDSDSTIEKNNELVYLLGHQLEQLFDPLSEYSPEPTERLYVPPLGDEAIDEQDQENAVANYRLENDSPEVQSIIEELFSLQAHFRRNIINFLQDFLIPLRVKVLGEEIPDMTIRKLNSIFPPTIDEIVRVNNIFYEALEQALPYGSLEIMKACGMTIPYFYKACMRHEAATRNFARSVKQYFAQFRHHLPAKEGREYTPRVVESIIQCSLHLARVKLVLDRLMQASAWRNKDYPVVEEFYQSAVGTIDAFGRETEAASTCYDRRVFTPTGKVLVEIAKGWPKELEYGWINRRVVTIFDAMDMNQENTHHIILLFTDKLVVLEPSEPIPMVSASGIHLPSIADILMHSMINEIPLQNVPELRVVTWASIEDVIMAEYNGGKNLCINVPNGLEIFGSDDVKYQLFYQLVRPDYDASKFVSMLAKAQVMNKTQPFHLFKNSGTDLSVYATVHELQGYAQEIHKTPVAVFMNVDITRDILRANNLSACFKVQFENHENIRIQAFTSMGCGEFDRVVPCEEFAKLINQETAYFYSLHYSTKNQSMMHSILSTNREITNHLVQFASTPSKRIKDRKSRLAAKEEQKQRQKASEKVVGEQRIMERKDTKRRISPASIFAKFSTKRVSSKASSEKTKIHEEQQQPKQQQQRQQPVPEIHVVPEMSRSDSSSSEEEVFEFPPRSSMPAMDTQSVTSSPQDSQSEWVDLSDSNSSIGTAHQVVMIPATTDSSSLSDRSLNRRVSFIDNATMASTEIDHEEIQEQRDVDEWFRNYESSVDELSLASHEWHQRHHDDDEPEVHNEEKHDGDEEVEQDEAVRQLTRMFSNAPRDSYVHDTGTVHSSMILDGFNSSYNMALQHLSDSESISTVDRNEDLYDEQLESNELDNSVLQRLSDDSMSSISSMAYDDHDVNHAGQEVQVNLIDRGLQMPPVGHVSNGYDAVDDDEDDNGTLNINDDFAHLAGFWAEYGSSDDNDGQESGRIPKSTTNLWPDLRDSSIMFLGSYVHSREGSGDSEEMVAIKEEEVSEADWLSRGNSVASNHPHANRQGEMSTSVSNLLRWSSATTLQLASFTVEIDRLIEQDEKNGLYNAARELERVKQVLVSTYEQTRNVLSSDKIDYEYEVVTRQKIMQLTWIIVRMADDDARYKDVVEGMLRIEHSRRMKLDERMSI